MSGAMGIADVKRLAEAEAPDLLEVIKALLSEDEPESDGDERPADDVISLATLRASLDQASKHYDKKQRQALAHEAWKRYLGQPEKRISPQIQLADLIVALYEKKTPAARRALLTIVNEAPFVYGIWGGLKRVFKRAEIDHDAEVFGALGARIDNGGATEKDRYAQIDVKRGTIVYLSRRVWRYLRMLGKATPELYPQFAVEVMRSYPPNVSQWGLRAATAIMSHHAQKWGAPKGLKADKKFRAPYLEAWKRSADPLMLLLETCQADFAASFAITGLRELFPDVLRKVTPEWLGRLAYRPLSSAHDFLIETLEGSPDFHQGKLKAIKLHDPVLALLISPSQKARKYAIEYARGHASDMPIERLLEILEKAESYSDTTKFIASLITAKNARSLGLDMVGRLVGFDATKKWATNALETEFEPKEIRESFLIDMLLAADSDRTEWAQKFIDKKLGAQSLPMAFWMRIVDDPRVKDDDDAEHYDAIDWTMTRLKKLPIGNAPGEWVLEALARDDIGSEVAEWLEKAEALPKGIDLERIKGLVFDRERRDVAFRLLGNKKLVSPGDVGLGWLLALARRADPQLHEWAHRYLLQHMRPEHFADGKTPDKSKGIARLFALALGAKEPEAVRTFAQTYLRCHHPKTGKSETESKQFNIKPQIPREEYTEERIWPALSDQRSDVRRFAVQITRSELRRWNAQHRVYELAESSAKEVRKIAYDALAQAGDPYGDPDLALKPEELDAAQIFSMTESKMRSSRDVAIELIRKHYARIGGTERLGWLMQSADREVRAFAVRLLWEKHRPRGIPSDWKPAKGRGVENAGAFTDAEALRELLKRILFTIPPSRSMEALEGARTKKLPSSVAKRNLVEIVRDVALEDAGFATIVAPVLAHHTGSAAKGEWQACLSALMALRSVHGAAIDLSAPSQVRA